MTAAIEAVGLTRSFGDRLAVDRLSIEVAKGEVVGFLGPNGAGKTTGVRLLCGLIAPSAGSAAVAGHDVLKDPDAVRASVGILTETPGLYERLSVARNLSMFADLYGCDDVPGRTRRWLERLQLWERRDDAAGALSKGMRQKLAIARALVHDPPVVFLDEPTSALDPEAAHVVRDAIADLKSEGRTIWLCTHNLDEAERLCDRVAVFRTRLLALDAPAKLRTALFGREVAFELAIVTDAHLAAVRAVPGVDEAARTDARILARVADPDTLTPAIVRALVAAGADVRAVGEVHHSLEEIYRAIVEVHP